MVRFARLERDEHDPFTVRHSEEMRDCVVRFARLETDEYDSETLRGNERLCGQICWARERCV